eukprot:3296859-Rhodomonas_salina.1
MSTDNMAISRFTLTLALPRMTCRFGSLLRCFQTTSSWSKTSSATSSRWKRGRSARCCLRSKEEVPSLSASATRMRSSRSDPALDGDDDDDDDEEEEDGDCCGGDGVGVGVDGGGA